MAAKTKVIEPPAAKLEWPQVLAWRTARQFLDRRVPLDQYLEVTSRLCGLHAQLTSSAELTLWARVAPFREQPAWVKSQIDAEAEWLAAFLGGSLELEWKN